MNIDSKSCKYYKDLTIDNIVVIHYFTTDYKNRIDGLIIELINKEK